MSKDTHEPRKLSTDELYTWLYKDYKKSLVKIGEMQSYIDELTYERELLMTKLKNIKNETKEDSLQVEINGRQAQNSKKIKK